MKCRAMVNVDVLTPSLLLGVTVIGSGVSLFTVRSSNARISKDSDVFLSSLIIVAGGTLVFQGWRLDPLMLLCQLMMCSVAATFALETLTLRKQRIEEEDAADSAWRTRNRPTPQRKDPEDEDTFFYDLADDISSKAKSTELPPARSSLDAYLSRDAAEMGWSVEGAESDPYEADDEEWPPWESSPRRTDPNPRRDDGVLQTIEDWE